MSPFQAAAVMIRLFAIWLGIYALRMIPSLTFAARDNSPVFSYTLFTFVFTCVVAVTLWCLPRTVTGRLLDSSTERPASPTSTDSWLTTGCVMLGLYMLTYAVPALTRDAFVLNYSQSVSDETTTLKSWVLYNFLEVAIALWLIFGNRGLRRLLSWARNAGYGKSL